MKNCLYTRATRIGFATLMTRATRESLLAAVVVAISCTACGAARGQQPRGVEAALDAQANSPAGGEEAARAWTWRFDDAAVGRLPEGWKAEGTNQRGPVATWAVKVDESAPSKPNVLALTDVQEGWGGTFNLLWTDGIKFKDGVIEMKVKAQAGQEDQGGGPMWRVHDRDNYYTARWNPLEDNFRLYYVQDGARKTLETATVKADPTSWHTIRIEHKGNEIACYFDGEKLLTGQDNTFPGAGGVGFWTKADAATSFDDLIVDNKAR